MEEVGVPSYSTHVRGTKRHTTPSSVTPGWKGCWWCCHDFVWRLRVQDVRPLVVEGCRSRTTRYGALRGAVRPVDWTRGPVDEVNRDGSIETLETSFFPSVLPFPEPRFGGSKHRLRRFGGTEGAPIGLHVSLPFPDPKTTISSFQLRGPRTSICPATASRCGGRAGVRGLFNRWVPPTGPSESKQDGPAL